jgi:hypothetical protein
MLCSACKQPKETRYGVFRSNIGLVLMRVAKVSQGFYCPSCFSAECTKHQVTNATVGWWGFMSFFTTLVLLPTNAVFSVLGRRCAPVAAEASPDSDETALALAAGQTAEARAQWFGGATVAALGAALCVGVALLQPPPQFRSDDQVRPAFFLGAAALGAFAASLAWRGFRPSRRLVRRAAEPEPAPAPVPRARPSARPATTRRRPPGR